MRDFLKENVDALMSIGFEVVSNDGERAFLDSPGKGEFGMPVIQACVYPNCAGHYSIDLEGDFRAPISCPYGYELDHFVEWLDENNKGWRG